VIVKFFTSRLLPPLASATALRVCGPQCEGPTTPTQLVIEGLLCQRIRLKGLLKSVANLRLTGLLQWQRMRTSFNHTGAATSDP